MATKKKEAIPVPATTLLALFGKGVDDDDVQAAIAMSGKVKVDKPGRDGAYITAKEAGWVLLLRPVLGAPKGTPQVVEQVSFKSDGQDGHRGFALPWGLRAGMTKAEVHAALGPSLEAGFSSDLYEKDGHFVDVVYTEGDVADVKVNGDYSTKRVLDLRIRRHRLDWDRYRNERLRELDEEAAAAKATKKKPAAR